MGIKIKMIINKPEDCNGCVNMFLRGDESGYCYMFDKFVKGCPRYKKHGKTKIYLGTTISGGKLYWLNDTGGGNDGK